MAQRKTYLIVRSQINMAPIIMENFDFQSSVMIVIKKKTKKSEQTADALARQRKYEAIGRALHQGPKWLPIPGPPGIPLPR